jgi:MoaA/NifB/PqqE/SkfB family radical SAM enzyme
MCNQRKHTINISEKFRSEIFELGPYLYDLQLHGGEMIISHEFERWTSPELFGKNPDLRLSLITNATTIPKGAQAILEDVRINYITVSINAASKSTYAFITASDLFENVIRNTIFLRDLGLKHRRGKFNVYLSFVITKSNYHELPDFINLAYNIGVPFRLLLVVGDRESIYTDTLLLNDVSFTVERCIKWVTDGDSIKELYMIHDALKHHISIMQNNVEVKKKLD